MVCIIKALDVSVVNKIAAGEIIISPVNALKEMMENSMDAGATSIDVLVKDGGIKILQITDNGFGIDKEDLGVLCERFTTSKLSKFEDLESIETYGFRGEALASISHIAKLTVTTKTKEDKCAWKVSYSEGKMIGEPKPMAGKDGTILLVEDLFYNIPSRLRALRSPSDEYSKIVDVMGRYAIHSENVGFSCKKIGDSNFTLTVRPQSTTKERIRNIYGKNISSNLIEYTLDDDNDLDINGVSGQVSDLNYNMKKPISPIFFINHRLVSCDPLRRSLYQTFSSYLAKGSKPFIYLSLLINPASVDVNVHPTKREVRFLNQDEIIGSITLKLNEMISKLDTSRTFKTASLLTNQPMNYVTSSINSQKSIETSAERFSANNNNKVYEHKLVRTDASQSKITTYMKSPTVESKFQEVSKVPSIVSQKRSLQSDESIIYSEGTKEVLNLKSFISDKRGNQKEYNVSEDTNSPRTKKLKTILPDTTKTSSILDDTNNETLSSKEVLTQHSSNLYTILPKKRTQVNLTSIKKLKEDVDTTTHRELTNIFANLTYVGVVDTERRLVAIQHDLKLFLVDYGAISYELFYQIGLTDFANFGSIVLHADNEDDLTLFNILSSFESFQNAPESIDNVIKKLWDMREMLKEYFSIDIQNAENDIKLAKLISIPLLLKDYNPPLSKLPFFLYRLATKVNWEEEEQCLDGILRQIALLYIPNMLEQVDTKDADTNETEKVEYITKSEYISTALENVLFPCIKRRFLAPLQLLKDVVEIANLPGLYKVFERC